MSPRSPTRKEGVHESPPSSRPNRVCGRRALHGEPVFCCRCELGSSASASTRSKAPIDRKFRRIYSRYLQFCFHAETAVDFFLSKARHASGKRGRGENRVMLSWGASGEWIVVCAHGSTILCPVAVGDVGHRRTRQEEERCSRMAG